MAFTLTRGTKEILPVDVDDTTDQVTSLTSATGVQFDVKDDANTSFYSNQAASVTGMRISCLVDTSAAHPSGLWPEGHYSLYVEFTLATESVRLGPIDIYVIGQS